MVTKDVHKSVSCPFICSLLATHTVQTYLLSNHSKLIIVEVPANWDFMKSERTVVATSKWTNSYKKCQLAA